MTIQMKTQPYPYQVAGAEFLLKHNYAILGDSMGLGKSLQALLLASKVQPERVLVLCPAFLKNNWENEFKVHTTVTDIKVCRTKVDFTKLDNKVVIINYEQVKHLSSKEMFDLVVVDESQYLKSMKAQRTKAFHSFIKSTRPDRLLLLSGTPIKNGVSEWYSPLLLCSYSPVANNGVKVTDRFKSEWRFQMNFCLQTRMNINGRVITKFHGIKNKEGLRTLLKDKYIRRTADKVLDLPEMVRKEVLISFSKDAGLEKAWDSFNSGLKGFHISTAKKESAFRKATFTSTYVMDLLDNDSGPVVIFSEHPCAVKEIYLTLQDKVRIRYIDGSVQAETRSDLVNMFQNGQLDILVATIGSASTGLTLTKSNNLVFNDMSWVCADNAQAEKRIHRIGQKKTAFIHYMLGSVIDEILTKNLIAKQLVLDQAM